MRAVLENAIHAAQNEATGSQALSAREAITWIVNQDRSGLFSFENICETLAINAKWLRAKVLAGTPLGGMPLRGAHA